MGMRWTAVVASAVAVALSAPGSGAAADKPLVAPAPSWVKPISIPPLPAKQNESAVRMLLMDEQIAFARGEQSTYAHFAFKIQTPEGLSAASLSFPWMPDTQDLTIHSILLHRGNLTIDVLAAGQSFTVLRREANLELAMLDGQLTANIQPEGVQVGDIVDVALTRTERDPVLKGHVESVSGTIGGMALGRAHLRAQWPSDMSVQIRQEGYPELKTTRNAGVSSIEMVRDNIEPLTYPKGAPVRFAIGPLVEMSDYASWAEVAALMAPLYEKAAILRPDSPLNAEIDRIRSASSDPKARAEAALALVQDRVRYVALLMGSGGFVPADADTSWSRRYGDCKGKTVLLLALLHALDIVAEPVLVSSFQGDGLKDRRPMMGLFDHVLVRASIGGKEYWLDGTRNGDVALDRIRVPAFRWGLPVRPVGATLVAMMPAPFDQPQSIKTIRIDATAGLSIPALVHAELLLRGDGATAMGLALKNLTAEQRDRFIRDIWKEDIDDLDVGATSSIHDPKSGETLVTMDGFVTMQWKNGTYTTHDTDIGFKADFSRDPGPNRDAPFAVPYPFFTQTKEIYLLPPSFVGLGTRKNETDRIVAGVEYKRHYDFTGNTFTIVASSRSVAPEFPFAEAAAAQTALRAMADDRIAIRHPPHYQMTAAEMEIDAAAPAKTADELVTRGNTLLDLRRFDEAIADFDKALALRPTDSVALADRGFAHFWKGDFAEAQKDHDAAAALDSKNAVTLRLAGVLAEHRGALHEAIDAYDQSLEIDPNSGFAHEHRARCAWRLGDTEKAKADVSAAKTISPSAVGLYLLKANILRSEGKPDEGMAEAEALTKRFPDNSYAQVTAGSIFSAFGDHARAMAAFDRALKIKPEGYIYLNRARARATEDVDGKRADIEAALKLDPKSEDAMLAKARLLEKTGDGAGAQAVYDAALANTDADTGPHFWVLRGIGYALRGKAALADKDFVTARAKTFEPQDFNRACWDKATAGVALESALSDCDAALAKAPDAPAYLDSKGLVLLRMNRLDDAIATYDRALAKYPGLSSSLFGRAVAWARKGDKAKSDADAAAALKLDPDIRSDYADYGLKLDGTLAADAH